MESCQQDVWREIQTLKDRKFFFPAIKEEGGALILNKAPTTQNETLFKGRSFTYVKPINMLSLYHKTKTSYQLYLSMSPTNPKHPQITYRAKKWHSWKLHLTMPSCFFPKIVTIPICFSFLFSSFTDHIYQSVPQNRNITLASCILARTFCHAFFRGQGWE